LRKAETQTLVSSRATSGTAFSLDLGPSPSDFSLHDFLSDRFGTRLHPREQALQVVSPAWLRIKRNQDTRFRFEPESPQRSQDAVFKHRMKRFFRPRDFFGQRHGLDYTGEFCAQQTDNPRAQYTGGSGIASCLRPHRADDIHHRRLSILYHLERLTQHLNRRSPRPSASHTARLRRDQTRINLAQRRKGAKEEHCHFERREKSFLA